jgi:hypothetical protein
MSERRTRNTLPVTHTSSKYDNRPRITIPDFLDVLSALHFASLVPCPVRDASGLMLIAPSGTLKSQLLMYLNRAYPNSCICDSNWHYGKLLEMRESFYNGRVRSIVIPELSSVYAGDPRTGSRMEAMLQQMAGEGSLTTNEADSRFERYEMRATIFAAMTPGWVKKKHRYWVEGFHRRFLWAHLAMENEEVLLDYLMAGKQVDLHVFPIVEPSEGFVPDEISYQEKRIIRSMLLGQKDFGPHHTRFMLMCRAAAVLKWHYHRTGSRKTWLETFQRFAVCLSKESAALLTIPDEPNALKFRKEQEHQQLESQRRRKKKRKRKKVNHEANGSVTPIAQQIVEPVQ